MSLITDAGRLPQILRTSDGTPDPSESTLFCLRIKIVHSQWSITLASIRGEPWKRHTELDQLQRAYKSAVETWIAAIREEEFLASTEHSVADVDKWEGADFAEEEARDKVKTAKREYEDALREKFFDI
jgi:hypothetical protein